MTDEPYDVIALTCENLDVLKPGQYFGVQGNIVTNKPKDVNTFALSVESTSDTEGYIVQKLSSSGEMFVQTSMKSLPRIDISFSSNHITLHASSADWSTRCYLDNKKNKTYNYLDHVICYTSDSVYTLRQLLGDGNVQCVGGDVLWLPHELEDAITEIHMIEGAYFPSVAYCGTSNSTIKLHYSDNSVSNTFTRLYTSSEEFNMWYYCGDIMKNISNVVLGSSEHDIGIVVQTDSNPTEISINGDSVPFSIRSDKVETLISFKYMTSRYNNIILKFSDGTQGYICMKNTNIDDIPISGESSSGEYSRKCINNTWTEWIEWSNDNSGIEWE